MGADGGQKIERLCQDPAAFSERPLPGTSDEEWLGKVLEAANPDPTASMEKADFQKKIQEFRSVVDLVHTPVQTPCAKKLEDFVRTEEKIIKALPMEDLLDYLRILEEAAFVYDPKTKELSVRNEELFLRLKNILKIIESLAYQDSDYLSTVNRPEIYRLAILLSPKLTAKGRGRIYRVENYGMSLKDFFLGEDKSGGLEFLRAYDGSTPLFLDPKWQEGMLLGQYAQWRWPEKERLEAAKALALEHQEKWVEALAEKGVSKKEWSRLSKLSDENLFDEFLKASAEMTFTTSPEARVGNAARLHAFFWVFAVRKTDQAAIIQEMVEQGYMKKLKNFEEAVSKEALRELAGALRAMMKASSTESPLDNYQARVYFIQGAALALNQQLKKEGGFREKVFDPLFGGFISTFIAAAASAGIPFRTEDFLTLVEKPEVVTRPVTWEEVRSKGELAVRFDAYPQSSQEDWLENEWEILKRISYQGIPVYDLARQVVDTVIFVHNPLKIAAGIAHPLFKTFESIYQDSKGKLLPVYERLRIVAHETFHNLEGMGYLRYGLVWGGVIAERDAYFFSATVLEEYLKLRLRHRDEKPVSDDEIRQILSATGREVLAGLTSNFFIGFVAPTIDLNDRTVELPRSVYLEILATLNKAGPKEQANIQKDILSAYPTPERKKRYLYAVFGKASPYVRRAARRAKVSYESIMEFFLLFSEQKRLCESIPDLQKISAGIFCKDFR